MTYKVLKSSHANIFKEFGDSANDHEAVIVEEFESDMTFTYGSELRHFQGTLYIIANKVWPY